jgi:hypothetical protein
VPKEVWIYFYNKCRQSENTFSLYHESLSFCVVKMAMKYFSLEMNDEALYLVV